MDSQWITSNELAHLLKADRRTINQLGQSGLVGAVKIGGQWRFPPDVIERLQELSRQQSYADAA